MLQRAINMKFDIENADLKEFACKISALDRNLMSQTVMCDEVFCIEDLTDFAEKHIEIQNAIMMLKNSEVSDYTIFRAGNDEKPLDRYGKICMLFKNVTLLTNNGFAEKFIVSCCRKEALEIYNILAERNKLNTYINLFDNHRKYEACGNDYSLYKISVTGKAELLKNDFIDRCVDAAKSNPYISLSICGFTLKEIKENQELINLFASFPEVYMLFCGKYSAGCYIINNSSI